MNKSDKSRMFDQKHADGTKMLYAKLRDGMMLGLEGEEIDNISVSGLNIYFYMKDGFQFKIPRRLE